MKFVLLEMMLVMGAIVLWTCALPLAAILFLAASAWKKSAALLGGDPLGPGRARMSRAAA